MRARLEIDYNYEPRYVDSEHCRFLTEAECEDFDQDYGRQLRERRLNPSEGDFKVLVLLIKFSDHADKEVPPREYYEELFNGSGPSDINEVGSMKDWLNTNSMGKYKVQFDVRDWEVAPNTESFYAAGNAGRTSDLQEIYRDVLTKIDNEGSVTFTDGYIDTDGFLNHLVVIHSGIMAEIGDLSCIETSFMDRIWASGSYSPKGGDNVWRSKDWFEVGGLVIASAFDAPACNKNTGELILEPVKLGVFAHEYCHGFGLVDLYDQGQQKLVVGGIGRFGIMASSQGWDISLATPGHLSGWSRERIGWMESITIEKDGYYALQPMEISSSAYKITHGYPDGEYLLIENKYPMLYDKDVEQGGIVVYHVDDTKDGQRERSYPGGEGWPAKHYRVAVVQADGQFHLEKGTDYGTKTDFFTKGMMLGSGGDQPNTDGYQSGVLTPTGISIEIMSNPSFLVVIRVSGFNSRSAGLNLDPSDGIAVDDKASESPVDFDGDYSAKTSSEVLRWVLALFSGLGLMVGLAIAVL
ncbi:hypothetical protein FisN_13Lh198 [Fistulifera solaris]|uniref:Peptidase M6-like domain-containing protein n=1 Tax=Fistulifera solaris TaxID=1519565 RepID=A0A1Z5KM96_FISSO|nr:hypothetical protein FisN_13Lh198 [Fistulifera solaris]|eukprot:GAX27245.1 hypothetical protein FisN_13Lh198 [Fistulifera solaris]